MNQIRTPDPSLGVALDAAVRDAADGIFIIDRKRQVVFVSDACQRITGAESGHVLGTSCACHELLECSDMQGRRLDGVLCPALKILNGEIKQYRQRMSICRADGERVWVETTYAPIREDNGEVSGVVAIMRDISEAIEREQDLIAVAQPGRTAADAAGDSLAATVADADLPGNGAKLGGLDNKLSMLERTEIVGALQGTRGQRTLAAQRLGISRSRLYRRMEALGIDPRQLGARESA
ncbi:MAG: PAS domain S-box protein [Planctomycetes bacterium]|nr:PAS domain S-box protein [Planctomycetota bacterium]